MELYKTQINFKQTDQLSLLWLIQALKTRAYSISPSCICVHLSDQLATTHTMANASFISEREVIRTVGLTAQQRLPVDSRIN